MIHLTLRVLLALLVACLLPQAAAAEDFSMIIEQQEFAGKPFQFQFWLQRKADAATSVELIVAIDEDQQIRDIKMQLANVNDLSKLKGTKRIKLKPYSLPNATFESSQVFRKSFPEKWHGNVRTDAFQAIPSEPTFVYQILVTDANGQVTQSRVKTTSLSQAILNWPRTESKESLITHPLTEIMVGEKDWIALTRGIKIPLPSGSVVGLPRLAKMGLILAIILFAIFGVWKINRWWTRAIIATVAVVAIGYIAMRVPTRQSVGSAPQNFCEQDTETKTQKLNTTSPIEDWTSSHDGKFFCVLEDNGLLRKVSWNSMAIEDEIQLPETVSRVAISKSFLIATDADNGRVWCLDRNNLEVKHVIPIDHCNNVCANPNSDLFLVSGPKLASLVDLERRLVTHTFPFDISLGRYSSYPWFRNNNLMNSSSLISEFKNGNLFIKNMPNFAIKGSHLLALSPQGNFFATSGSKGIQFHESADARHPIRQYDSGNLVAINDASESLFLGWDQEIRQFGLGCELQNTYDVGFKPQRILASPTCDCILAASEEGASRISLAPCKKYALLSETPLTVTKPEGESTSYQKTNLPRASISALKFDFKTFTPNVVYNPDGKTFYVVNDTHQLLEIRVADLQISRVVDLELPISDLAATPKGIAVLLKTVRKAVVLEWESLQAVSSLRVSNMKRLAGHLESNFLLSCQPKQRSLAQSEYWIDVHDLTNGKLIGGDNSTASKLKLTGLDSLVHRKKSLRNGATYWTFTDRLLNNGREFSLAPDQTKRGLSIELVSGETRILDLEGAELASFDLRKINVPEDQKSTKLRRKIRIPASIENWAIAPDQKSFVGFGDHCLVVKLVNSADATPNLAASNPAASNPAASSPVASNPAAPTIGPTPAEVWRSLSPEKRTWEKRAKYGLISSESHIFVGKMDDYSDIHAFNLQDQKFLPQFKARRILPSQDGKFLIHDYRSKSKRKTKLLDSKLIESESDIDVVLSELLPIPFTKNGASTFLNFYRHVAVYDPTENTLEPYRDYFPMDYDASRQKILARKTDTEEAREFFWLDPATGQVDGGFELDFLSPGETIRACRISHDGKKLAVFKTGENSNCAVLDLENEEILWEGIRTRSAKRDQLAWSRNDKFVLFFNRLLIDAEKGNTIDQWTRDESLTPVPNTDMVAAPLTDKRTIEIIDPIGNQVVCSIAKRKMVRVSIRDASEIGSKPIVKEYEEILAWSLTRDGKFLVTLTRPYRHPRQLSFFDIRSGREVKSFSVPWFK